MRYRIFYARTITLIIVIACIMITNNYLLRFNEIKAENVSKQQEELAQNNKEGQSLYKDGTYQGTAKGFGGDIIVSVTIKDDKIKSVDVVSAINEDAAYLDIAKVITSDIVNANSTDVDTVSGATYSSAGIKNAAIIALEDAK